MSVSKQKDKTLPHTVYSQNKPLGKTAFSESGPQPITISKLKSTTTSFASSLCTNEQQLLINYLLMTSFHVPCYIRFPVKSLLERSWSTFCKSAQMGPSQITCQQMQTTADHPP